MIDALRFARRRAIRRAAQTFLALDSSYLATNIAVLRGEYANSVEAGEALTSDARLLADAWRQLMRASQKDAGLLWHTLTPEQRHRLRRPLVALYAGGAGDRETQVRWFVAHYRRAAETILEAGS